MKKIGRMESFSYLVSMRPIHRELLELERSADFDRLDHYKNPDSWQRMNEEERLLLAKLFLQKGALNLAKESRLIPKEFLLAEQITLAPNRSPNCNKEHFCGQQRDYPEIVPEQELTPQSFFGWYNYGLALLQLGFTSAEMSYLITANNCFQAASLLLPQQLEEELNCVFHWKWGNVCAGVAKISGEPADLFSALEKFKIAEASGCQDAAFLCDFGEVLADLGTFLEKEDYFLKSIELFNKAIEQAPDLFIAWWRKGFAILRLSDLDLRLPLLDQADFSFFQAAKLDPTYPPLWFRWGQLQTLIGKIGRNLPIIESSLEKFQKAYQLCPDQVQILSCWAETELFLGSQQELLPFLRSAKEKEVQLTKLQPDVADHWFIYGSCLNELGHYFEDSVYYEEAIEKFQAGIALTHQSPFLWYGLASAYFGWGELSNDPGLIENAVEICNQVLESGGGSLPQFWNDWGVGLMRLAEIKRDPAYAEAAIEKFEQALKNPEHGAEDQEIDLEWLYNCGCAYDILGHLNEEPNSIEKSVQIFSQILELEPSFYLARYQLACALAHLGSEFAEYDFYQKANFHFEKLLESNLDDDTILLDYGLSLVGLARLVQDLHVPERAEQLFHKAESYLMQSAALGNSQAYYHLGGLYSIVGHEHQALHFLNKARLAGALPSVEELLHDEWLESVRNSSAFRQFIQLLTSSKGYPDLF